MAVQDEKVFPQKAGDGRHLIKMHSVLKAGGQAVIDSMPEACLVQQGLVVICIACHAKFTGV